MARIVCAHLLSIVCGSPHCACAPIVSVDSHCACALGLTWNFIWPHDIDCFPQIFAENSNVRAALGLCAPKTILFSVGDSDFGAEATFELCNKAEIVTPEVCFNLTCRLSFRAYMWQEMELCFALAIQISILTFCTVTTVMTQ